MPKVIDSQALGLVDKALGVAGRGAQITEFEDGQLDQVLDVGPLVRRGRTPANTGGIFRMVMENVHAAGGDLTSIFVPYSLGAIGAIAPYPNPVPDDLEVWVLYCFAMRTAGAGTPDPVGMTIDGIQQGYGRDDSAVAVVSNEELCLVRMGTPQTLNGVLYQTNAGFPLQQINLRIPRFGTLGGPGSRCNMRFHSTASAACTVQMHVIIGLFPLALGQDVVA